MGKFKELDIEDKEVMRDMVMMCVGMWTDKELLDCLNEGIITQEDYEDLSAGMIPLN